VLFRSILAQNEVSYLRTLPESQILESFWSHLHIDNDSFWLCPNHPDAQHEHIKDALELCICHKQVWAFHYLVEMFCKSFDTDHFYNDYYVEGTIFYHAVKYNAIEILRWLLPQIKQFSFTRFYNIGAEPNLGCLFSIAGAYSDRATIGFLLEHGKGKKHEDQLKIDALREMLKRVICPEEDCIWLVSLLKQSEKLREVVQCLTDETPESIALLIIDKLRPWIRDALHLFKSAKYLRRVLESETIGKKYLDKCIANIDPWQPINLLLIKTLLDYGANHQHLRGRKHEILRACSELS
jgi:hypothetical protein